MVNYNDEDDSTEKLEDLELVSSADQNNEDEDETQDFDEYDIDSSDEEVTRCHWVQSQYEL